MYFSDSYGSCSTRKRAFPKLCKFILVLLAVISNSFFAVVCETQQKLPIQRVTNCTNQCEKLVDPEERSSLASRLVVEDAPSSRVQDQRTAEANVALEQRFK